MKTIDVPHFEHFLSILEGQPFAVNVDGADLRIVMDVRTVTFRTA